MKNFIPLFLIFAVVKSYGSTNQISIRTIMTCQQSSANQWIEVGIAYNDSPGLKAFIVSHHSANITKENSSKLIFNSPVYQFDRSDETTFEDNQKLFKLSVSKITDLGRLYVILDDARNLIINGLICYKNSSITFDN